METNAQADTETSTKSVLIEPLGACIKRYDLHRCEGGYECSAELLESSTGDWVDAVDAINTIAMLNHKLKIMADSLYRIAYMSDEVYSKGAYCSKIAREALEQAREIGKS